MVHLQAQQGSSYLAGQTKSALLQQPGVRHLTKAQRSLLPRPKEKFLTRRPASAALEEAKWCYLAPPYSSSLVTVTTSFLLDADEAPHLQKSTHYEEVIDAQIEREHPESFLAEDKVHHLDEHVTHVLEEEKATHRDQPDHYLEEEAEDSELSPNWEAAIKARHKGADMGALFEFQRQKLHYNLPAGMSTIVLEGLVGEQKIRSVEGIKQAVFIWETLGDVRQVSMERLLSHIGFRKAEIDVALHCAQITEMAYGAAESMRAWRLKHRNDAADFMINWIYRLRAGTESVSKGKETPNAVLKSLGYPSGLVTLCVKDKGPHLHSLRACIQWIEEYDQVVEANLKAQGKRYNPGMGSDAYSKAHVKAHVKVQRRKAKEDQRWQKMDAKEVKKQTKRQDKLDRKQVKSNKRWEKDLAKQSKMQSKRAGGPTLSKKETARILRQQAERERLDAERSNAFTEQKMELQRQEELARTARAREQEAFEESRRREEAKIKERAKALKRERRERERQAQLNAQAEADREMAQRLQEQEESRRAEQAQEVRAAERRMQKLREQLEERQKKSLEEAEANARMQASQREDAPAPSTGRYGLPAGWGVAFDAKGRLYFIDHLQKTTTYKDPRPLPPGWGIAKTQTGRVYYENHSARTTQFQDPRPRLPASPMELR